MDEFSAQGDAWCEVAPEVLGRALRQGGWFADAFVEHTVHHVGAARRTRERKARITLERQVVHGASVRLLTEDTATLVCADAPRPDALCAAADAAGAQSVPSSPPPVPGAFVPHLPEKEWPEDAPDRTSETEKRAVLRAAVEAPWLFDARVEAVDVRYHDRVRRLVVLTSEGTAAVMTTALLGLRVTVTLKAGGASVEGWATTGSTGGFGHFFSYPPEHVAREAVEQAQRRAKARALKAGTMPVILAAGWGGVWLHEALGHRLEADQASLPDLGARVASGQVTLVDDGTLPHGRGTQPFDDEGTPARRTVLIEDGVVRARLTDRRHARRKDAPCTGNGRRQDYRHAPLPRMTNLLLEPGDATPDDLIADVRDGLYVRDIGHGTVRPDGTFRFDVREGYRIEQGRLTHPVTGVDIVGEGWASLRKIVGLGADGRTDRARGLCEKEGQVVPVSVGMPTVLLKDMQVVRHADG